MRTTEANPINHQPTQDPWLIRLSREKVDNTPKRDYSDGVPRIVMQTVWRTPAERVPTMKVAVTEEVIVVQRLREAIPNPFLEVVGKGKDAKSVIASFDDGKTRHIALEDGDSLSGTIDRLRVAAKSLPTPKGVRVAYDGNDKKNARGFRMELIPLVTRTKKEAATTEAAS